MELLLVKDIKSTIQVCLNSICTFVYGEYARGEGDWGRLKGEGGGALTCISVAYIVCINVTYIVDTRGPSGPKNIKCNLNYKHSVLCN